MKFAMSPVNCLKLATRGPMSYYSTVSVSQRFDLVEGEKVMIRQYLIPTPSDS